MQTIATHIEHIGKIVAAQQTYARRGGVTEEVDVTELVDHAIALNFTGTFDVTVRRDYQVAPRLTLDRHKLIQILGNLLGNARHALRDLDRGQRVLTVRLRPTGQSLAIEVEDTGVGIAPDVLTRLFTFGFTTKKDGHGFGLHSSALAANTLGGSLTASSDGPGTGATFSLELDVKASDLAGSTP
jgi:C4-dicarboxylate-specific signal transduction histidine kinase